MNISNKPCWCRTTDYWADGTLVILRRNRSGHHNMELKMRGREISRQQHEPHLKKTGTNSGAPER